MYRTKRQSNLRFQGKEKWRKLEGRKCNNKKTRRKIMINLTMQSSDSYKIMCFGCGDIYTDSLINAGCEMRMQENRSAYEYDTEFFLQFLQMNTIFFFVTLS